MNTQPKILVVEDESSMQVLLRYHLNQAGFHVTLVSNGLEAKDTLRENRFELICSDVMMSGIDGVELCRWVRCQDHLRDVPFILLSSRAQSRDQEIGIEAGADVYLTKPFDVQELVTILKRLANR